MLLIVSAPLPDDVTVTAFVVAVFRVTVPNATLVGLTVIAGEDDPAGETFTVKVFDTPPYEAVMVTFWTDLIEATGAVNCPLL